MDGTSHKITQGEYKMNTRYIPENSNEIKQGSGTVYTYTSKDNKPAAIAYIGNQSKNFWHYRFMSDAQRTERINQFFEHVKAQDDFKAARKAERKAAHSIKVGDILYASWGYDQTNINFFQVTAVTEKTVTFGEIAQKTVENHGHMSMAEDVTACKDTFLNDKRYTRVADGKNRVTFAEFKGDYKLHLSPYDGRPLYQSHYA